MPPRLACISGGPRTSSSRSWWPRWSGRTWKSRSATPWSPSRGIRSIAVTSSAMPISERSRIFVAGHRGLVGSALVRRLEATGHENLLLRTREELDLTDQSQVRGFFEAERPDAVLMAAARVGGIYANNAHPARFIRDNLLI